MCGNCGERTQELRNTGERVKAGGEQVSDIHNRLTDRDKGNRDDFVNELTKM